MSMLSYQSARFLIRLSKSEPFKYDDIESEAEKVGIKLHRAAVARNMMNQDLIKKTGWQKCVLTAKAHRLIIEIEKDIDYANSSN